MTVLLSSLYFQFVCLVIILRASSQQNADCGPADGIPQDYVYCASVDTAYNVSRIKLSWNDSRTNCMDQGATLGVIEGSLKVQIVTQLKRCSTDLVWTGNPVENSTNENLARLSPSQQGKGSCVAVGEGVGVSTQNCAKRLYFVCEIAHPYYN